MSHLNRRQALRLFAAAGAAGLTAPILSACSSSDDTTTSTQVPSGPPIKIGMIVPQTGMFKDFGNELDNGFSLYLQQHDTKLGGRPVTLVKADEGETADSGKAAAGKLINDEKVLAITGVANPAAMLAMAGDIENAKIPLIGSNASPKALQTMSLKYNWRTSFVSDEPGFAIAKWAAANAGGQLAVCGQTGPGGDDDDVASFVEQYKSAGGNVAGQARTVAYGSKDFANMLNAVKSANVQAVYALFSGVSAVEFVKQFRNMHFPSNVKLFGSGPLTEGAVLKQQGDAAKDIVTALNYSPDLDNVANRRFVADYQKAFGTVPSTYAMASYDAAAVLDKAIADATRSLDSVNLNAAIGRLGQIDSPRGGWQFSQTRTPLQRWYLRQVRNDGAVLSNVLTAELATRG
ncbi:MULTISPECIES: ABC transporter substrate-binding protein [Dactylosporangium]|uniref:ABC transporter substrate-binding protein n=2 Tax=Dactylosporangium TaxID=35753 RepID=A0A9W6KQH2_9ACTN|nr:MULTISPECIES: ABC transporter substrate-binding protein [Dactylosporangium]UAB96547.1 ABC transporter substrate-binding protein [Dactylosporangium vinaceum]UWZ44871.1 ABC transporter substrate-binding protein [Dactylosporangium matsuzakiense]GLL03654.1 ABC transporter substrate-binding protein [Dactylosporangium matsuzakiense]